ncbi:hypothetical protein [Streptomyces globisporus]
MTATAVQHSIARLLAHIAKLMQALGATSRTHLGALLVRSGIVEADRREQ